MMRSAGPGDRTKTSIVVRDWIQTYVTMTLVRVDDHGKRSCELEVHLRLDLAVSTWTMGDTNTNGSRNGRVDGAVGRIMVMQKAKTGFPKNSQCAIGDMPLLPLHPKRDMLKREITRHYRMIRYSWALATASIRKVSLCPSFHILLTSSALLQWAPLPTRRRVPCRSKFPPSMKLH